jgi:hypothetical protein
MPCGSPSQHGGSEGGSGTTTRRLGHEWGDGGGGNGPTMPRCPVSNILGAPVENGTPNTKGACAGASNRHMSVPYRHLFGGAQVELLLVHARRDTVMDQFH